MKYSERNLPQCGFVHGKSHMDCYGKEFMSLMLETGN
jgi:hypothetical protein